VYRFRHRGLPAPGARRRHYTGGGPGRNRSDRQVMPGSGLDRAHLTTGPAVPAMVVQGNCLRAKGGGMVQATKAATGGAFDWKWLLLSIKGLIPRSTYWLRFIPTAIALGFVSVFVDMALGTFNAEQGDGVISGLFGRAAIWPSIATGVKRLHDRNQTGGL